MCPWKIWKACMLKRKENDNKDNGAWTNDQRRASQYAPLLPFFKIFLFDMNTSLNARPVLSESRVIDLSMSHAYAREISFKIQSVQLSDGSFSFSTLLYIHKKKN